MIADTRNALGAARDEVDARGLVEQLAVAWTAVLAVRHGDGDRADTYSRSRADGDWGTEFGILPGDAPLDPIAHRAVPGSDQP